MKKNKKVESKEKEDQFDLGYTFEELIEEKDWNNVLAKLNSMRFTVSSADKNRIIKSNAPDWLKNATYLCKTVPSA